MITISLCMIVKNEETVLARCLDSIVELMDEIIIVDTGSQDNTKKIAARYTDKIFDFQWKDDFSAARNFAFSKATKEYIYSADADEVLDTDNQKLFFQLKQALLPEIEIVQMKYGNQLQFGTVYNYDEEYRPKLFKRLRSFIWEGAIHETVRLEPVVYDSEIIITHKPTSNHAARDLDSFYRQTSKGEYLSSRLLNMYARELFVAGKEKELKRAAPFFHSVAEDVMRTPQEVTQACCVSARAARMEKNAAELLKYVSKVMAQESCSEICLELGEFYEDCKDYEEATIWYYNAAYETQPILDIRTGGQQALKGLIRCYQAIGMQQQVDFYKEECKRRQEQGNNTCDNRTTTKR